tara:strand:+ start:370 stop:519 length:150 start_codon:yes stop_codon:yes gene_type:complete
MTRNPQTKNKNVLNIKPTSALTVVSALTGETINVNKNNIIINLNFFIDS